MKLVELDAATAARLRQPLAEFEREFRYPLGPQRSFRVSHGEDYGAFVRALGVGATFVVADGDRVLGAMSVAQRELRTPVGDCEPTLYICDLKVLPRSRQGFVLRELLRAALRWGIPRARSAYGVVMRGTENTPERYSGRAGMPHFTRVRSIAVLRVSCTHGTDVERELVEVSPEVVTRTFDDLRRGGYVPACGDSRLRSRMRVRCLLTRDRSACALIEDTRRAKRLFLDDGSELVSAHLSCFGYRSVDAAVELITLVRGLVALEGLPAVFVATPEHEAAAIVTRLDGDVTVAAADIYGFGVRDDADWSIHTAEI